MEATSTSAPRAVAQPSLAEFLAAPLEEVRKVAPVTMILGTGGTRRRAVLAGLSTQGEDYAQCTREQMMACYELIFQHGVQHLVALMLVSSHNDETTPGYREKLVEWTAWAVVGAEALAMYTRLNWRVRLIGVESWPELMPVAAQLIKATETHTGPTLWYSVASRPERTWSRMLQVAVERKITSRTALIDALYGEAIPPATLYLGAGKPQVEESQIPPLLTGKLECYWRQHLGYDLDAVTLRKILYDYAYLRPTWQADKTGRAEQVTAYAQAWQDPPVIGMGRRLGPFWYPAPIASISEEID
ncbi:MAG: hypothetical protein IT328_00440 [Caldilineaceae bacterium]|nr:hypothetical protein [Caldilineaceae bacterium]